MYFVHCADFQNSFLPNLISVWSSPINKGEPRGKITSKLRNKGHVEERCNLTGEIRTWGISEQFVLSKQKEWRLWTCNKSKICEQSYTLPTFQNGRNAFDKGSSPRKRLFDKDRSKRCLFWHTSRQEVRKYIRFQWEVNLYEFLCLCFGQGLAPLIFTKYLKIPIAFLRRINVRIIFLAQNFERNFATKRDVDFSVTKFRFCDKFWKVASNTNDEKRVFGVSDKFSKHDVSHTSGNGFGYPKQMHATYSVTEVHNYGNNQTTPRKTLVHCSGGASRQNSVQVLGTTTNSGSERKGFLSKQK